MTPNQRVWARSRNDLAAALADFGYPEELADLLAKQLGSPKAIDRMASYIRQAKPRSLEMIVDEMNAICAEIDAWREKKESRDARESYNRWLNSAERARLEDEAQYNPDIRRMKGGSLFMKKLFVVLLLLVLAVSAASADTITAVASEPYMETYAKYACCARIHDYDSKTGMLEVELIMPEIFDGEDVKGLQPGDAIYTGGQEVVIETITEEDGYIILNKGDYPFSEGSVWLKADLDGNYRPMNYEDYTWLEMARLEVPVTERLLLLDYIDPSSGLMLEKPTVHSAAEFLAMKDDKADPGFDVNNVIAVLDENGDLAVIERYYVPWQ